MVDVLVVEDDAVTLDADNPFSCSVCGPDTTFATERGKKIHESRLHGIKSTPPDKVVSEKQKEDKQDTRKRGPLLNKSKRLSSVSRELTTDLVAAGAAWMAVRWIEGQGVAVANKEQFLIPEADRKKMLRPILDGIEFFTPAVQILNTLAERFDYIECFLLWKAYANTIRGYVNERKNDDGTFRQSPSPNATPGLNGYEQYGFDASAFTN